MDFPSPRPHATSKPQLVLTYLEIGKMNCSRHREQVDRSGPSLPARFVHVDTRHWTVDAGGHTTYPHATANVEVWSFTPLPHRVMSPRSTLAKRQRINNILLCALEADGWMNGSKDVISDTLHDRLPDRHDLQEFIFLLPLLLAFEIGCFLPSCLPAYLPPRLPVYPTCYLVSSYLSGTLQRATPSITDLPCPAQLLRRNFLYLTALRCLLPAPL
jgi:hypothetical protein